MVFEELDRVDSDLDAFIGKEDHMLGIDIFSSTVATSLEIFAELLDQDKPQAKAALYNSLVCALERAKEESCVLIP